MTGLHLVRLQEAAPQPWRNGGGLTRELLAWSPDGGGDWALRVSVAQIERDGPFSAFAGVERCFVVLEGAGVRLGLPAGERRLTPADPPCRFAGEDAPACHLLAGPTRDLNLMGRRAAGQVRLWALGADGAALPGWQAGDAWRGVYTATPARLRAGDVVVELPADTLAWSATCTAGWCLETASAQAPRAWGLGWRRGPGAWP